MFIFKYLFSKLTQFSAKCRRVKLNYSYVAVSLCVAALLWAWWPGEEPGRLPRHLRKLIQFPEYYKIPEKQLNDIELASLKQKVEQLNANVEVINWSKYLPVNSETTVIVVLAHKDVERLQYLITSLGQVKHIEGALLIFSHSYFDDKINSLVKEIEFCKVMQIFFPHSLQLNPNEFPGFDPDDCNVTRTVLPAKTGSVGADTDPVDAECFDRDAHRTQHKHHWWWTANYVFEAFEWSSDKQITIFLEEDNYVLPDLLHMLRYARRALPYFPSVEVMSFGRQYAAGLDYDMFSVNAWSPPYDKGLAFNRTTWRKIASRSGMFCFYDDCSWSYSLVYLFGNFTGGAAEMAACVAPRVLSSGVLDTGRRAALWAGRVAARAALFPAQVRATVTVGVRGRVRRPWRAPPRGNGGWNDLRDQTLCLDPLLTTTSDITTGTTPLINNVNKNDSNST